MWDIDGLFNNRLLQIEQLVRRSELYTRDTLARIREEAECVCVHLGRAGENKREKETKHLKKKKKKKLRREFIILWRECS